ncbi:RidA family protein [Candidatus Solincola tengchongensis]|uniref:RidA family protein n=1 Tax=Candidatus Solincola tengchongensis TaxID=2900693 RepID=UPI00257E894B|nr:RidA family protein [Candidatus Solincola tengchongensis]
MSGADAGNVVGGLPTPKGPYSLSVTWENLVFVSGLLAVRSDGHEVKGDVREEAMVVLRNLETVLREAGSGLDRLLMVHVYLKEIAELPAFNEVYEEIVPRPYPARSVAGVDLPGGFRVELAAVAHR